MQYLENYQFPVVDNCAKGLSLLGIGRLAKEGGANIRTVHRLLAWRREGVGRASARQ